MSLIAIQIVAQQTTASGAGRDAIGDCSVDEGDRIGLSSLDANATVLGDQAFNFVGGAAFSAAGQARAVAGGGITLVSREVNGDGTADFALRLNGMHSLGAGTFVL